MASKLCDLLERYQENVYPAMLDHFSDQLGVSSNSLTRLGVGWVPIVSFKKAPSYQGWWAIPELDTMGNPIGIGLRAISGDKLMYPGSKHGLIYEVNPEHQQGTVTHRHYPFIRMGDIDRLCPLCGKPDGCMITSDDYDDPQACICIRVEEGAKKAMKLGHLHILKPEARSDPHAAPLIYSERPTLIVEGMTDVAAAMDLDFVAVGRPSNLAGIAELSELVRGRNVVVIGENDKKWNPKTETYLEPGKDGMFATFQAVLRTVKSAKWVMPPETFKDLRHWVNQSQLTTDELIAYIEERGQTKLSTDVLPDTRPKTVAESFLGDQHTTAGKYTVKNWRDDWYCFTGTRYEQVSGASFEQGIYPWAHDKLVQVERGKGEVSLNPLYCDGHFVNNVLRACRAEVLVPAEFPVPRWINEIYGPDPYNLISFANGILDIEAFLSGKSEDIYLLKPTADYFTLFATPYAFDSTADCPLWMNYLDSSLGDEPEKIATLQEWFGYCLVPDNSLQKFLYLRGVSGAGKSLALNVLTDLIGNDQVTPSQLDQLAGDFGLEHLQNKLLITINDAKDPKGSAAIRGLEVLLKITGGDSITLRRKYKDTIAINPVCRIAFTANSFLSFPDHDRALDRRLLLIDFNRSFVQNPDIYLQQKLQAELPGIANWALLGLHRLREQGGFTISQSSTEAMREIVQMVSPMASFVEECCEQSFDNEVVKTQLFDAWDAWSRERNLLPMNKYKFFERLQINAPLITSGTCVVRGRSYPLFKGIKLQSWAEKTFLGKPQR